MNKSGIEWTELTWNPLRGCSRVSEGCRHCYAERMAARFSGDIDLGNGRSMANMCRKPLPFDGVVIQTAAGPRWTGEAQLIESKLTEPLHRRKPSVIFVNSMSDTFHEKVPDEWLDRMFAVMALCPQHRFIVLTKRSRMREYFSHPHRVHAVIGIAAANLTHETGKFLDIGRHAWPLPNLILGVSVEDRASLHRLDDLRETPAACRMLSAEPLLEDLGQLNLKGIGWVIVGGESGPGARPMHPDWVRSIRDQCVAAGVPFFFKQWGSMWPVSRVDGVQELPFGEYNTKTGFGFIRKDKKAAGRLLDGKVWGQRPEIGAGR